MKCSANCANYDVYISDRYITRCIVLGHEIKVIKEKMPHIYNDCPKFKPKKV
jgi:hypothetical protein